MARLTTGQKAQRVVRFLLGIRRPRVVAALGSYGFSQATLDEGWTLLRGLVGERLAVPAAPVVVDPSLIDRLDEWENKWFVIAEATLGRHHPEVRDAVFLNLSRTTGPEVTVSVGTFLQRLSALAEGSAEDQVARALLDERGLNADEVGKAREILDTLGAAEEAKPPVVDAAAIAAAEQAMWDWYLEWSAIAQLAIKDGRLLRALGYRRGSDRAEAEEEEVEGDQVDDGVIAVPIA